MEAKELQTGCLQDVLAPGVRGSQGGFSKDP